MTFKLPTFNFPRLKLTAVIHRPKGRPAEPMKLTLPAISLNAQSADEESWDSDAGGNDGWSSDASQEGYESDYHHEDAGPEPYHAREKHLPPPPPPPPPSAHRPYYSQVNDYRSPQNYPHYNQMNYDLKKPINGWDSEYSYSRHQTNYQSDFHQSPMDSNLMAARSSQPLLESRVGKAMEFVPSTSEQGIIAGIQQNSQNLNFSKPVLQYHPPNSANQPYSVSNSVSYPHHHRQPQSVGRSHQKLAAFGDRVDSKAIGQRQSQLPFPA